MAKKIDSLAQKDLLLKKRLDPKNIPEHVAIIMDGNRRWAKRKIFSSIRGHKEGARQLDDIVRIAAEMKIKTLTVFAFSTENWNRSKKEVDGLFKLLHDYLIDKRQDMKKEGVKLDYIGDISKCDDKIINEFEKTKKITENGNKINLVLAINYGSKDEIRRAIKKIIADYDKKKINKNNITEELIEKYLDTSCYSNPDLLIRTAGEKRVSNFLLWQIAYSELYFVDKFWPDFTRNDFLNAILSYQERKRRFGK